MKQSISSFIKVCIVLFTTLVISTVSPLVVAQDSGKTEERKTTKTPTMSEPVYKKLIEAQELIEDKQYEQGLVILREMEAMPKTSSYEKSQIFNFFAYTYFTLEKYQDALRYYEKVIAEPDNTKGLLLNTLYTVAQLYFVIEDYPNAIQAINRWFKAAPEPSLNAYMLLGQAYYQLEKYPEALTPLVSAKAMLKERGETPREILLLLLQNLYLQTDNYPKMIEILRELVVLYPKAEHWRSLAAAYSEQEHYDWQMSILEMLYETGNLDNGRSQMNLANLYLMHDAPYKAAILIDKGMTEGKIEEEERNLQLLAQSWQQAQETKASLEPLIKATNKAKDGNLHVRLAQSYIGLDMYKEAANIIAAGLKKGGIDRPDQAYLMQGMANFELKNWDPAISAFTNASKDKRSKKAADDWIKYVTSEKNRVINLERSLENRRI
jgi:tetratricopeptide (TPR) repeat protein